MSGCDSVITIPQFSGTCWFNALLMAMLYSDGMRKYLKNNLINSELFKKNKHLYIIFNHILNNRYRKINNNDDIFFNDLKPENILEMLNKIDNKHFYFNPRNIEGHLGEFYFVRIFEYFGLKKRVLFLNKSNANIYLSPLNLKPKVSITGKNLEKVIRWNYTKIKTKSSTVLKNISAETDILVITPRLKHLVNKENFVIQQDKNEYPEIMELNGNIYKLDSLLLTNFNFGTCRLSHQIAGVTCKNERYMYNGWIRNTQDPAKTNVSTYSGKDTPCELMKYDWLKTQTDFCLGKKACKIVKSSSKNELCFNSSNFDNATYIYVKVENREEYVRVLNKKIKLVKKNCDTETGLLRTNILESEALLKTLPKNTKEKRNIKDMLKKLNTQLLNKNSECEEHVAEINKIINDISSSESVVQKTPIKPNPIKPTIDTSTDTKCSEDKVLNPKTNRCVNKTGTIGKELLKSTIKTVKPTDNKCSEDKVLNPKTNRCVNKTGSIGKQLL
jgi:hypothetical protein